MASMQTFYGPDSITTQTSATGAAPSLPGLASSMPDMEFFRRLAAAKLAEKQRQETEARRRQAEADRMTRQRFALEQQHAGDEHDAAALAQQVKKREFERSKQPVPDKWITTLQQTQYGDFYNKEINPEYERWAAAHGQFDVGPDSTSFAPSVTPGASDSDTVGKEWTKAGGRPSDWGHSAWAGAGDDADQGGGDERPDWFGTGSTNRKRQLQQLAQDDAAIEADGDYLQQGGGSSGGY